MSKKKVRLFEEATAYFWPPIEWCKLQCKQRLLFFPNTGRFFLKTKAGLHRWWQVSWLLFLLPHHGSGPAGLSLTHCPPALQPPSDSRHGWTYKRWLSSIVPSPGLELGRGLVLLCRSSCLMQQGCPAEQPLPLVLLPTLLPAIQIMCCHVH